MLRRSRRPAALVAPLFILSGLARRLRFRRGGSGFETADRLDAVTIEGDPGEVPTIEWKERMTAGKVEAETLVEGDGAALADGDQVLSTSCSATATPASTRSTATARRLPASP